MKEKKKFENLVFEVINFDEGDVITTSVLFNEIPTGNAPYGKDGGKYL